MATTLGNEVYYTTKELSKKFNVCMETIRDWRVNKGLKSSKIGRKKYIFSESDVKKFLEGK